MNAALQQWLLNLAVDFPVPLRLLPPLLDGDDRQSHALNVKSIRGVTLRTVVARLIELAESGLIIFTGETGFGKIAPAGVVSLMNRPGAEREVSFELTAAGGMVWETSAQPRWHEMEGGSAIASSEDGGLMQWDWTRFSQCRDRLMAVLGWFPMVEHGAQIDHGTVRWEFHSEYQVRYWKRLPNVYVVSFRSWSAGDPLPQWKPRGAEPEWFTTWTIARSSWYLHPWEMAGWPVVEA